MHLRADEIERVAIDLITASGPMSIPVDLRGIARHLGVEVHEQTFEDPVSGVLLVRGQERHIMVNRAHHPNRQRFSIAHELGHLVLHHQEGDQLFVDTHMRVYQRIGTAYSRAYKEAGAATTPLQEKQANQFASALLMPKIALTAAAGQRDLWDEGDVSALAADFAVSEQAMAIRLRDLDLLDSAMSNDDQDV